MDYPVRKPVIITQGFSQVHEALDFRNTDLKTFITYPHYAMERSMIIQQGKGQRYVENYILMRGMDSGLYYLYCHNTLVPSLDVAAIVGEGEEVGKPDMSGKGNTGYHLHLEIWSKLPEKDKHFRLNPLTIMNQYGLDEWRFKDGTH